MSCPSSGCNYQQYSQSQKMSIGIVVESSSVGKPKEADASIMRASNSNVDHLKVKSTSVQRVKASSDVNTCRTDVQEGSVRVTPGLSSARNRMEQPDQPALSEAVVIDKDNKRVFMDETSVKQQVTMPVKEVLQEQPTRTKEALRMKLREILGTVPSGVGDDIFSNAKASELNANERMSHAPFMPRQNSDTIETDSENVDTPLKRPVTRSLAKRRVPARKRQRNIKPNSLSSGKLGHKDHDVFSFAEKSAPSPPCVVKRSCSNGHTKRSFGIKPGDMLSPVTDLRNIQPEVNGCEKAPPVEELPLGGEAIFPKHGCLDENLETEATLQNLIFNHSPEVREKSQSPNAGSPAPQEKSEHLEPLGGKSPVQHVDELNSPWFEVKKTALNSPMGSCPLTNDKKQKVNRSSLPEGGVKHVFENHTASDKDNSEYSVRRQIQLSSDGLDNFNDSDASTPEPSTEEKDAGNRLFATVSGEFDSTQEDSSAKKVEEDVHTSSEIRFVGKPMLFRSKRLCSNGVDFSDFSPVLHTPKVVASGNADDLLTECFDDSPEDGLARVVSLLGLALEKVKRKMLSVTNKRCSEILVSTAEEIHSQLRSVESQIQTDIGKLTSLKTSKRKHLETRLQEQQVRLKVMHEKFKEEICQYLQDCKGAMEGLETQHIELQGAIERQKALHRKLFLQTEAAVETHLTDAQRQMMFVRKLGKQKLQQLQVAIAECLTDGISR